jgi:adenylate cyclase
MNENKVTRKLTAILSADVMGYGRLMADDEEHTVRTITDYRSIIADLIISHWGRVVDSTGDNLLADFSSVVDAVRCAVDIQGAIEERNVNLPQHRRMQFRIGINLGDVIQDGDRIYGDGVNIASRLEALADAGGICISAGVYEQVRDKLDVGYEYLGEQRVKNISAPVRVFHVVPHPTVARSLVYRHMRDDPRKRAKARLLMGLIVFALLVGITGSIFFVLNITSSTESVSTERIVFPVSERPSIAVLPFENMSSEEDQEYFSDGLTEDLITDLSKISGLFVIARNSSFAYKGRSVKIGQVAQELGVRYILRGSVRKQAGKVRINAKLIDTTTGYHLWAERYDRDMVDIFLLQDEVVKRIVSALKVHLTEREMQRLVRQETRSISAYDLLLQARDKNIYTMKGNLARRSFFQRAIEIDPEYAEAYTGLGWTYFNDWAMGWNTDPEVLDRAFELAERSFQLQGDSALAPILMGEIHLWRKEHDRAIEKLIQTIKLYPNEAMAYAALADILIWSGLPRRAISVIESAIRLDPLNKSAYWARQAQAHLLVEEYGKSMELAEKAIASDPDYLPVYLSLAIASVELGLLDKARDSVRNINRINPNYSFAVARRTMPYRDPAVRDRHFIALHKAGLN